ncbi:MAG: tRNA uridine-5-carboxymethylaminomethyl(34) synthesis GTPase MnmE, partial [Phenylobacterium sp.]
MTDTIFAPATAAGRAAVAVVRLSGPGTAQAVRALAGRMPAARRASLRTLTYGGVALDEGLVLWMPAPGSYTGEDSAEFHVHGGPAVVSAVVEALSDLGLRLAEPGEFTRRAFEHGKLDLAQAEGVADLVDAETEGQRRQALAQLGGRLSGVQARWRDGLVRASAMLEAAVDFPDEELPADVAGRARPILEILADELEAAAADVTRGEQVREGFRIALLGAPNAGKSTLLNALAKREAAIVSATPGTTRDIIEVPMVLGGYKVIVADTAGLRKTEDEIEAEGVRRAEAWAESAGLRVWLVDGYGDPDPDVPASLRKGDIVLLTKRDLGEGLEGLPGEPFTARSPNDVAWLERSLTQTVVETLGGSEFPAATRLRHRDLLTEAATRL